MTRPGFDPTISQSKGGHSTIRPLSWLRYRYKGINHQYVSDSWYTAHVNVVWAESLSKKFVPQSKSLHSNILMPSIDVHAAGRSIRFGCGVFRSQVDASNCSLGLYISLYFCVVKANSSCWQTNVIQCGCLGRWFMSTGFQNYVSIQGFPAAYCTFIFFFFFFGKGCRRGQPSTAVMWGNLPSHQRAVIGQIIVWSFCCFFVFCSDDASVLHLCCVFFYMCWCQPQSGSYGRHNP